jgi:hypothetical protein
VRASPALAVALALALAATLASARASAHSVGLSRSTFEMDANGMVHGELVLATADVPSGPMAEIAARGIDVRADGESCPARFVGSRPDGGDGVAIDVDFDCTHGAGGAAHTLEAELFVLSDMPASSQNVASVTARGVTHQAALDAAHRTIRLEIGPPSTPPTPARSPLALARWAAWGALAIGTCGALVVGLWLLARRRQGR